MRHDSPDSRRDASRLRSDPPREVRRRDTPAAAAGRPCMREASSVPLSSKVVAQRLTRPRQPRLHRPDRHTQGKRDVVVAQTVDLPEDDGRALIERQAIEGALEPFAEFFLFENAIRPEPE